MKIFTFYFFLFTVESTFGQSNFTNVELVAQEEYQLDWKYRAGQYLIYDCDRGHYACINKTGLDNCVEERNYAIAIKAKSLKCAPLKNFTNKKECIEKSYKLVDIGAIKRFCYPK